MENAQEQSEWVFPTRLTHVPHMPTIDKTRLLIENFSVFKLVDVNSHHPEVCVDSEQYQRLSHVNC